MTAIAGLKIPRSLDAWTEGWLLGLCFLREAPERAIGSDQRAGKWGLVFAFLAAVVAGRWLFRLIFHDADDFWDCVKFSFTPNLFSLFRGQYFEDMTQSLKLGLFVLLTGLAGAGTYWGMVGLWGRVAG